MHSLGKQAVSNILHCELITMLKISQQQKANKSRSSNTVFTGMQLLTAEME